ncbi:uncharacterized protein HMPREF1120_05053 [Exophiala dermatitidis NIH/UT8656]|uniref:Uncharacterized protein n=1 Tax=Exophiala dermatitidis (strain ATCC 34100 / CBS 525.76 / NIH/UT8656) TaxID=858893 RepID=H6BZD4_EXODN|nr:uncharacterized protein HMPREF1120_05053 [Exophiala dermatitidis NIH/UT8656]EHY56997.1 hypothetical protein HMPREF1120_05053 [Exophiala dermatitidis NIH/UT8656]
MSIHLRVRTSTQSLTRMYSFLAVQTIALHYQSQPWVRGSELCANRPLPHSCSVRGTPLLNQAMRRRRRDLLLALMTLPSRFDNGCRTPRHCAWKIRLLQPKLPPCRGLMSGASWRGLDEGGKGRSCLQRRH